MNKLSKNSDLQTWLSYLERPHTNQIKLGLERVKQIAQKLQLNKPPCPVITVTGTNGKGSCVAMLEAVYTKAGYQVGAYTSPHLIDFNERIRINQQPVIDSLLCEAFAIIEQARAETFLTYFELVTLAALWIFAQAKLDVIILEVGIGGRLDVTNLIDPSLAIISAIGIDHTEYLGTDRAAIATEKAGIMRAGKPAICGDANPPHTLVKIAQQLNVPLAIFGKDYYCQLTDDGWKFWNDQLSFTHPQRPYLHINNMATIIQAILKLQQLLPVAHEMLLDCITQVKLPGRFQVMPGPFQIILDVAHNPHAAENLAAALVSVVGKGKVHAIFSMLADKDISNSVAPLKSIVTCWHIAALNNNRAASLTTIKRALIDNQVNSYQQYCDIETAYNKTIEQIQPGDTLLVYGSFYTVGSVYNSLGHIADVPRLVRGIQRC